MKLLVEEIFKDAIHHNATDIHLTLESTKGLVRVRCRGEMLIIKEVGLEDYRKMVNFLKFVAELDINEHKTPQSGRTALSIEGQTLNVRISTLPISLMNEIIVIRMLNAMEERSSSSLFYQPTDYDFLLEFMVRKQGLILFTGPTGSGKSTLMYRLIQDRVLAGKQQIISIEDPVEYEMDGLVQVEINEKANIDYQPILKGVLRCDPDIIMFGEIRDANIASQLLKASLSGHLVLSTFHSKSAISTLSRLKDYGLYDEEIIQSISLIINQRLIYTDKGSFIVYEKLDNTQIATFLRDGQVKCYTLRDKLSELHQIGGLNAHEYASYLEKFK
ncbi:competence type IV pilus ATPase ComGA [Salinicoccus sesuvii]|uniref:Competence type IV pilus ATPase ComGA n=1 Tax=Salinicoccus sesuvii TaxID=868281 RepID=A0ABV7N7Q0_9STAP